MYAVRVVKNKDKKTSVVSFQSETEAKIFARETNHKYQVEYLGQIRRKVSSEAYKRSAGLLARLHGLMKIEDGDPEVEAEADLVRDQMDGTWKSMSVEERIFLTSLSAEFYNLTEEQIQERLQSIQGG